jgi:DNA modification methylase
MIINADCLDEMRKMQDNSIAAIVTDAPYGLGFMGKDWDAGLPHADIWAEALRICKPGAHLLAFGGTRTYHRLTCAIEDAGWQIRDCLMWIYGSGFPKSHNHFGLEGYGSALKPAYEPIIMAMKPYDGTFKENVEKWQQGGINIDASRISTGECLGRDNPKPSTFVAKIHETYIDNTKGLGRWPANVLFDEEAAKMLDEQSGISKSQSGGLTYNKNSEHLNGKKPFDRTGHEDSGGASRFFYCAKASSSERSELNNHPTVKPLKLMEYLIKLVMPPKDGLLLDPFAGSGTTILAAQRLGFNAIGIEKSPDYCAIAEQRITNDRSMTIERDDQQIMLNF